MTAYLRVGIAAMTFGFCLFSSIQDASAQRCQVTYDRPTGRFYNGCAYKVEVTYTATCGTRVSSNNSGGSIEPGKYGYRIAYPNCDLNFSWRAY